MIDWAPGPALAAYHSGVTVICELAAQFTGEAWAAPTICPEWRAADLAGHLRCVVDDYHEYLDDAPVSRMARLMARGPSAESLARKLARQNAAELAALPDATGPEHIAAFAAAARDYAYRALGVWDLPHHRFGDTEVTVGGMVGAACAEWHLHAWDLAASLGKDYQPASPELLAAGWQAGMPHLPLETRVHVASCGATVAGTAVAGAAVASAGGAGTGVAGGAANGHPHAGASHEGAWQALLRASGRLPRLPFPRAEEARMSLDVSAVRAAYPALADGYAYLDGAAGTQLPAPVIDAISDAHRSGLGNSDGAFPASARSDAIVAECRQAVADLVGGHPAGVILGPNMTTLTYRLAATLARDWRPGDEVIVSRLDHDANIRPWVQAAARAGAVVRWAEMDLPAAELPAGQYDALLSERTRLVAVTAASNILGTRPDVAAITAKARAAGALSYVDGVHATPHGPTDVAALGADFYATSAYKWSGPHIGAVIADPALLEPLRQDKLNPAPDTVPDRFEWGTPPFADFAGVTAAVDHLAGLGAAAAGTRRRRLLTSMAAAHEHEQGLLRVLLAGLAAMDKVTLYGNARNRTATVYFNVAGLTPRAAAEHLAERKVNVWDGDNYAWEPAGALGIRDTGGAVRAGLVHYNDRSDVDRLLAAVAELAG